MQLNQVASSVLNMAGLTVGSVVSTVQQTGLPPYSGLIAWTVTVIYGILQIIKCIPWFSDQCVALWQIMRHWNWTRWWKIAGRDEQGGE